VDGAGGLYNLVTVFANVVDAARCVESRGMIGRAPEIADGIVLWARPSSYILDVVVPEITEVGRRAGLDLTGFGVLAAVPAATDDVDTALKGIRAELHRYFDCLSTLRCSTRQATATMSPLSMRRPPRPAARSASGSCWTCAPLATLRRFRRF
jgi:hypothetical protein